MLRRLTETVKLCRTGAMEEGDFLIELLTYECPYTGKKRLAGNGPLENLDCLLPEKRTLLFGLFLKKSLKFTLGWASIICCPNMLGLRSNIKFNSDPDNLDLPMHIIYIFVKYTIYIHTSIYIYIQVYIYIFMWINNHLNLHSTF